MLVALGLLVRSAAVVVAAEVGAAARVASAASVVRVGLIRPEASVARWSSTLPPLSVPFLVREYAHRHTLAPNGDRTDFAETVFWHPVLVLPKTGATVSFDLSDAVTRSTAC